MSSLKRRTDTHLPVEIKLTDVATIDTIIFIFKQEKSESSRVLKRAMYRSSGESEVIKEGDMFYVPFTKQDTARFKANKPFYMDTLITVQESDDNLTIPIAEIMMEDTLFGGDVI